MILAKNFALRVSAVAVLSLFTSPQSLPRGSLQIVSVLARSLEDNQPTEVHDRASPAVTLHLSPRDPASICSEVLIRPRAAEQRPTSRTTCRGLVREASDTGCEQAESRVRLRRH